jgi:hypothetical protein
VGLAVIIRVCNDHGCSTILSKFNPEETCWNHTDLKVLRAERRDTGPRVPRQIVSERFRDGVPTAYDLSRTEAESYRSGRWLGLPKAVSA